MPTQPALFPEEERRLDLSQWYTPPDLARRMVIWALYGRSRPMTILEPAAGKGALILPIPPQNTVIAYDIDETNISILSTLKCKEVRDRDFLSDPNPGKFDLCITNPPYENDQDAEFIRKVVVDRIAAQTVGLLRSVFEHGVNRWERVWKYTDLQRKVIMINRPKFGGTGTPLSDFCLFDMTRRDTVKKYEQNSYPSVEWWRV